MGMRIKISDGQTFHMRKQIITQPFQRSLAHIDQYPVINKCRYNTDRIKASYPDDRMQQSGEIRIV